MRKLFYFFLILFLTPEISPQWVQTNETNDLTFMSLAVSDMNLFAGTYGGVYLSTNNGTSWTAVNSGLTTVSAVHALAVSGTNLFAGATYDGVFLSTNNGTNWTAVNNGLEDTGTTPTRTVGINALAVSGTNLYAAAGNPIGGSGGVFLSTNNGTRWTAVDTRLSNTSFFSLAVSGTNLFAGAINTLVDSGGVFLCTNNGTSWTAANSGLTKTNVNVLAVLGTNLFAGTGGFLEYKGGVFFSTNNGSNWTAVNTGLTNDYVFALVVSGANLFAGTGGGVFLSTNNGTSWSAVNSGLSSDLTSTNIPVVRALAISGTNLFAGTIDGVWRRPLSEMITDVKNTTELPKEFALYQNYPNPFNPSTNIQYAISSKQFVTMKVYDILGNEVAILVNEEKPAGTYEVTWNTADLPSGVYFYQLKAGIFAATKKLLLLK